MLREDQVQRLEEIGLELGRHVNNGNSQVVGVPLEVLDVKAQNSEKQNDVRRIGCEVYKEAV